MKTKTPAPKPHGNKISMLGNRSALRHGLRSFEKGRWPAGSSYAPRITSRIAEGLRDELTRLYGGTTIYSEALISTIRTHEARALLVERLLRRNKSKLSPLEQAELLRQIGAARTARDQTLAKLGLSIRPNDDGNIWDAPTRKLPAPDDDDAEADDAT